MPIRHPKGSDAPASSPATRIGVCAVGPALDVAPEEADGAAVAVLAVAHADDGLEALHVQPVGVAARLLPVLGQRVEHLGRAAGEGLALAPVGAQRPPGRRARGGLARAVSRFSSR